jgi:hypothetical protein
VANTFTSERTVADPAGGPSWTLVVWRTQTGGWCSYPGRRRGEEIGSIDAAGKFTAFPFHQSSACTTRVGAGTVALQVDVPPGGPTVVSGVAGKDVVRLDVAGVPGLDALFPSARGGFLAVVPGAVKVSQLDIEAELRDGSRRRVTP